MWCLTLLAVNMDKTVQTEALIAAILEPEFGLGDDSCYEVNMLFTLITLKNETFIIFPTLNIRKHAKMC